MLVPHSAPGHLPCGVRVIAIVEHRAQQHLTSYGRCSTISGQERGGGCQTAACTYPNDDDSRQVDVESVSVTCEPLEACVAIMYGRRMPMLRGKSVAHRDDGRIERLSQVEHEGKFDAPVVPKHHAAAVDEVDHRCESVGRSWRADHERYFGTFGAS